MYQLGMLYEEGKSVAQDEALARKWYEKAAAAGQLDAAYKLAGFGDPDGKAVLAIPTSAATVEVQQEERGRTHRAFTVVELHLAGYSNLARDVEQQGEVEVDARFDDRIQELVDVGLAAVHSSREDTVRAKTGDGA